MYTNNQVDNIINNLIKAALPYPDEKLCSAVESVRMLVRDQQLTINQMKSALAQNRVNHE